MAKEILRASQFGRVDPLAVEGDEEALVTSAEQQQELDTLYRGFFEACKPGGIVKGIVVEVTSDGVLVDINYKSDSLISRYEFTQQELKGLKPGSDIEVILDALEGADGSLTLSYEKAKAFK